MAASAIAKASGSQQAVVDERWGHALLLTGKLTVELQIQGFTVADMLRLEKGSLVPARWRVGTDVPLQVNGTLLAYGEFEVAGERLAVRLTELA